MKKQRQHAVTIVKLTLNKMLTILKLQLYQDIIYQKLSTLLLKVITLILEIYKKFKDVEDQEKMEIYKKSFVIGEKKEEVETTKNKGCC